MRIQEKKSNGITLYLVAFIVLVISVVSPGVESKWDEQESSPGYHVDAGEIIPQMTELLQENSSLQFLNAKKTIQDLESTDNEEEELAISWSSTMKRQAIVNPSRAKQIVRNCLSKNFELPNTRENMGPKTWYPKCTGILLTHYHPRGRKLAQMPAKVSYVQSNEPKTSKKTVVIAIVVTAGITLFAAALIFFCWHKFGRGRSDKRRLHSSSLNDNSIASLGKSFGLQIPINEEHNKTNQNKLDSTSTFYIASHSVGDSDVENQVGTFSVSTAYSADDIGQSQPKKSLPPPLPPPLPPTPFAPAPPPPKPSSGGLRTSTPSLSGAKAGPQAPPPPPPPPLPLRPTSLAPAPPPSLKLSSGDPCPSVPVLFGVKAGSRALTLPLLPPTPRGLLQPQPPPPPPPLPLLRPTLPASPSPSAAKPSSDGSCSSAPILSGVKTSPPPYAPILPPRATPVGSKPARTVPSHMPTSDPPKAKLKPLFWDKIMTNPDHSMVWHQVKVGSFKFNEEMIEKLFGHTPPSQNWNDAYIKSSSQDLSTQCTRIIDPKKSQNLSILLKALNLTTEEICDALAEGTELPPELIQTLLKMAPTAEEETKLRQYTGKISQLNPAERFLKSLVDIPFAFKRLESLLFMCTLDEDMTMLKESFAILEDACTELRKSRLFLKLLEAVLKTGNRLNDGTFRGCAEAFKLDTLLKLSDVKGTDGKTTLLHFVVRETVRYEGIRFLQAAKVGQTDKDSQDSDQHEVKRIGLPIVSGLGGELEQVKKAAALDIDSISETVGKLWKALAKVKDFWDSEMKNVAEEEGFHRNLKSFVNDAELEVEWLVEEEKRIMGLLKDASYYFHRNAGKEGLKLFGIVRDFVINVDKICKELENDAA